MTADIVHLVAELEGNSRAELVFCGRAIEKIQLAPIT